MELTKEKLHELFEYRDGKLFWKVRLAIQTIIGAEAGYVDAHGYIGIRIYGKMHKAHRIIFFMHFGYFPRIVDHIDFDTKNNNINNLRAATDRESLTNRRSAKGSSSKYLGVFNPKKKYWNTRISINGKNTYMGSFSTEEAAALAYNKNAVKYYGEFANLNIIIPNEN